VIAGEPHLAAAPQHELERLGQLCVIQPGGRAHDGFNGLLPVDLAYPRGWHGARYGYYTIVHRNSWKLAGHPSSSALPHAVHEQGPFGPVGPSQACLSRASSARTSPEQRSTSPEREYPWCHRVCTFTTVGLGEGIKLHRAWSPTRFLVESLAIMSRRPSFWVAGLAAVAVAVAAGAGTFAVAHPVAAVGGTAVAVVGEPPAAALPSTRRSVPTSAARTSTAPTPASRSAAPRSSTSATVTRAPSAPPTRVTVTAAPAPRTVTAAPAPRTVTVTEQPTPTTQPSTTATAKPPTRPAAAKPTIQLSGDAALYADTDAAVAAVDAYWKHVFTGWQVTWHGPVIWAGDGYYDSDSTVPGPSCNGQPIGMNASFCGHGIVGEGVISWDLQLMRIGYQAFGDSFVYLVVAHEWGHVAQERFEADGQEPAVLMQKELQADCLAGATLTKAAELGYIKLEPGDTDELIGSLNAVGDSHTWSQSRDHGSSDQRVAWFTKGFNGDIESCLGQR